MTPENGYNKHIRAKTLLLAGFSVACAAFPARSQEAPQTSVYDLDAYVVVANRQETPLRHVGSSVQVLEGYDLQKGRQAFLLDAIRFEPGFFLRNSGGPGNSFAVTTRGLNSNTPTLLIDGIDMSNPADGRIVNPGLVPNASLARVEILKGPQSSLYGANALAGVISLETPDGETRPGGELDIGYGSRETFQGSLAYGGATGDLSWRVSASRHETAGFSVEDPTLGAEWADDDAYRNTTLSAKLKHSPQDGAETYLTVYYIDSYSEFDPGAPSVWVTPAFDNHADSEKLYAKAGSRFRLADNWDSEASFMYARSRESSVIGADSYPFNGDRYTLEWQNNVDLGERWDLVSGASYESEDNRADIGKRDNVSVFAENLLRLSDRLDWTLGGRFDHNSDYGDEPTWRSTFSYRLDADGATRLHGSYGTSFQAPTFYQLSNPLYGSPDVRPESGSGWDLGIDRTFGEGAYYLGVTAFGNEVEDKIVFSFDTSRYANEETYKSKGLETDFRAQLPANLSLRLAHTYSEAEYGNGQESERAPRHVYSAALAWRGIDDKLDLTVQALRVGSRYSLRSDAEKQESYATVNLSLAYQLNESYQLWARVDNLFDEEYEEIANYQTPGVSAFAGARLGF